MAGQTPNVVKFPLNVAVLYEIALALFVITAAFIVEFIVTEYPVEAADQQVPLYAFT